ncbi:accessory gene regulator B family protein [Brevibacillus laterosporus]|uniref:accessory gene regulator ArgB-like protein n=1 Tax=Brevibacillus laterosporus TaxID=1465 RepID=UPI003D1A4002
MVERVATVIAHKIRDANPEENVSATVLAYSLAIQLNGLAIIISSLTIGILTNRTLDTFIALVSFSLLRLVSGGYHAKNMTMCYLISTVIISFIPHLQIDKNVLLYFNIITFMLVAIYAPRSKERNNISLSTLPYLKIASILLVCVGFYLDNSVVSLSLFAQAITLTPVLERGCQP